MAAHETDIAKKPETVDDYRRWLDNVQGVAVTDRTITHYEAVTDRLQRDFASSHLWVAVTEELRVAHEAYLIKTGYPLLRSTERPPLRAKPFSSFLLKTFRRNVRDNPNWPDSPPGGWLLPSEWFSMVKDMIRTRLEVKYLDGVQFLGNHLLGVGREAGYEMALVLEAKTEGYYAAHIDVRGEFEIPTLRWDTERRLVSIELQITTQLQEVILALTHQFYEERRIAVRSDTAWQWNYASPEFVANYLGHILHYMEGMILEVRDNPRREVRETLGGDKT